MSQAEYGMQAKAGSAQRPTILTTIAAMFAGTGAAIGSFGATLRREGTESSSGPSPAQGKPVDDGYLRDLGIEVDF